LHYVEAYTNLDTQYCTVLYDYITLFTILFVILFIREIIASYKPTD